MNDEMNDEPEIVYKDPELPDQKPIDGQFLHRINKLFSYSYSTEGIPKEIYIHIGLNASKQELDDIPMFEKNKLFETGLQELAKFITKTPTINKIVGLSSLVAEHPDAAKGFGFSVRRNRAQMNF